MGDSLDSEYCISVFISYDLGKREYPKASISDKYTVHPQNDLAKFKEQGYAKVLITKKRIFLMKEKLLSDVTQHDFF